MKQKLLSIAIAAFALSSFNLSARNQFTYTYEGATLTYTVLDEELMIAEVLGIPSRTDNNKPTGPLKLPAKPKDGNTEYTLTSIGIYAFAEWDEITSVSIPESVTRIHEYAFLGCQGLTSIEIPKGITEIRRDAFADCKNIEEIYYNAENCTDCGSSCIFPDSPIKQLIIGDDVKYIPPCAFSGLSQIESVTIPNDVTSIGYYSFESCDGLKTLNFNAENCIEAPQFPSSLEYLNIGEQVRNIPDNAFNNCYKLTSLVIPKSVTSIGQRAFSTCNGLEEVTLDSNISNVGDYAFSGCENLKSITIQGSIENLGVGVFNWCTRLTNITIEGLTNISDYLFANCTALESIKIPNSVIIIGESAFSSCENLSELTLGNSIKSIGGYAFVNCEKLKTVVIPNSVVSIAYGAFDSCYELTDIVLGNAVESIGEGAFAWCSSLASVLISNSVSSIGDGAFAWCSSLASILIPNSVLSIGEQAFEGCTALSKVTLPNMLESIGKRAFEDCGMIDTVEYLSENPCIGSSDTFEAMVYNQASLIIPEGYADKYKNTWPWSFFKNIKEKDINGVKDVTTDGTKSEIDYTAAYEVYNLNGVYIGSNITDVASGVYLIHQGNLMKKVAMN